MKTNRPLPKLTTKKAASLPQRAAAVNANAAIRLQNKQPSKGKK